MSISFNSSSLSRELVISRYNEDLNWTKYIDCFNVIKIYNKGNDIEYPYLQLENIQSKSYDFYKNNLDRLSINRYAWNDTVFNPWSYESMWHYIFNKNILEK